MATISWQLDTPIDAIIFDCDGTLSTIEGIDELAEVAGVGEKVKTLTENAMGKTGINPELYEQRLKLVQPTYQHVLALADQYYSHRVADIENVIALLKRLDKKIYIASAGINPSVKMFGEKIGIPVENIFAVDIQYDAQGKYVDFDRSSPFTRSSGKRDVVTQIKTLHPRVALIGDGLNDYAAHDIVTRFIGYGGAYYRQNIADLCEFYITTQSMTSLLPLVLTQDEIEGIHAS